MALKKIKQNKPLARKVEEQIKESILKKVFKPGERLPSENELVSTFEVSRTAIREAIHRLAGEGLIKVNGRYGIFVSGTEVSSVVNPFANLMQLKFGDMSLLYLMHARMSFEPEITRLAAKNRTNQNLEDLNASLQKMIDTREDRLVMAQHDMNFHRILSASTDNPIIPIIMEPIYCMLDTFIIENFQLSRAPEAAIHDHQQIIKHIAEQNEEEAYNAMANHMNTAKMHWDEQHLGDD